MSLLYYLNIFCNIIFLNVYILLIYKLFAHSCKFINLIIVNIFNINYLILLVIKMSKLDFNNLIIK